ncbi:MAG: hypothetical protein AABX54_00430 [Nanoarchaeota archaeon]
MKKRVSRNLDKKINWSKRVINIIGFMVLFLIFDILYSWLFSQPMPSFWNIIISTIIIFFIVLGGYYYIDKYGLEISNTKKKGKILLIISLILILNIIISIFINYKTPSNQFSNILIINSIISLFIIIFAIPIGIYLFLKKPTGL